MDLEVLNDAEQDKNIKSKIKNFSSASIYGMNLDGVMGALLKWSKFHWNRIEYKVFIIQTNYRISPDILSDNEVFKIDFPFVLNEQ